MTAISNRMPAVTVEYDCRGQRVQKSFADAHAAKRWYVTKDKAGKNPKVVGSPADAASTPSGAQQSQPPTSTKSVAAYVRVSTVGQNEAGQRAEIERWSTGNGIDVANVRWFLDKQTGDNLNRPAFDELQSAIFAGEIGTIVVYKLDRISRKLRDGINVLCDWCDNGLRVVSVTQQIDFNGTVGRMIASVLLGVAQMEQETRRERQAAGIAIAKQKGKYKGRKPGTTKAKPERAMKLRKKGLTAEEIAKSLGVSRNTVFRYFRQAIT